MTLRAIIFAIFFAALSLVARADEFPTKPITLVVPWAPGGNNDVVARLLAKSLSNNLGQPIVVQNKSGAGGMIGGQYVATADPDGYTLLVGSNAPVILSPLMFSSAPYRWEDAFEPISIFTVATIVLEVRPDLPAKNLREVLAYAKANPEKFSVAIGGTGSINHLLNERLQQVAGLKWVDVNYKGNAPALIDLVAGHIDASFDQLSSSLPMIQLGSLKAIAVVGDTRAASLPDVPTFAESGFPEISGVSFNGLFAPKNTPRSIIDKLSSAMEKTLKEPELMAGIKRLGSEVRSDTPDEFKRFLENETMVWQDVVNKGNLRIAE
jgi:tripartite-type tricarboxylate transporter receptor subunit TctC